MENNTQNSVAAVFFVAVGVVVMGGLATVPAALQEAGAQSGTHSEACVKEQGRGNPGCVASIGNPSNPNALCESGRDFGGNRSGTTGNC
jgi:hypothetical protein